METTVSRYMNLSRIEFFVTRLCNGRCKHCQLGEAEDTPRGSIDANYAAEAVAGLKEIFPIESVMTFGGEPLLYPDAVCTIHKRAYECAIPKRQLITNGCFTKNHEKMRNVIARLKEAGVNDVLLSVDAFHQETLPADLAFAFSRGAIEAGLPVRLHPAWVVNDEHDNPYNNETRKILKEFSVLGIPISNGNNIFLAGNAAVYLAEYYGIPKLNLNEPCGSMPYTNSLTEISSLSINPNGDVMVCGFSTGNIYEKDICSIVRQYDPYQNERMNAIIAGGVPQLLALAKSKGDQVDLERCHCACDVCRALARG